MCGPRDEIPVSKGTHGEGGQCGCGPTCLFAASCSRQGSTSWAGVGRSGDCSTALTFSGDLPRRRRTSPRQLSYRLYPHLPLQTGPPLRPQQEMPRTRHSTSPDSHCCPQRSLPGGLGGGPQTANLAPSTKYKLKPGPWTHLFPTLHLGFPVRAGGVETGE